MSSNQYNGEPVLLYGNCFTTYPSQYPSLKEIRSKLFLGSSGGYFWNKNGWLCTDDKLSINLENALKLDIPEGHNDEIYGINSYSSILTFPENITDEWFNEVILSTLDLIELCSKDRKWEKDLFKVLKKLNKSDRAYDFVQSLDYVFHGGNNFCQTITLPIRNT